MESSGVWGEETVEEYMKISKYQRRREPKELRGLQREKGEEGLRASEKGGIW